MLNFHIITLFPDVIEPYIKASILGRAISKKKIAVFFYNPRDFLNDPRQRVDARPFGGGPGMVMRPEPLLKAINKAKAKKKKVKIIFFDRKGRSFTNKYARELANGYRHIIMICGRYEGVDARVYEVFKDEDIVRLSLGDYILTGGEIPALAVVDCVSRQIPGVLGDPKSLEEGRVAGRSVYTRPSFFVFKKKKYTVPEILRSGDHAEIEKWKKRNA